MSDEISDTQLATIGQSRQRAAPLATPLRVIPGEIVSTAHVLSVRHGEFHPWQSFAVRQKPRARAMVPDRIAEAIRDLAKHGTPWPIVLVGRTGGGKTCAALCAIDHFGGWYTELADFSELILRSRHGDLRADGGYQYTEADVWRQWTEANLAVIDEIGLRTPTDNQFETLKRMLDRREHAPLIVISNFRLPDLARVYDDRIVSRLACGTVIETTTDRRLA